MKKKKQTLVLISFVLLIALTNTGCKKKPEEKAEITESKELVKMPLKNVSYKTYKIDFGTAQGFPFLRSGWSFNEKNAEEGTTYNWALGKSASIFLTLPKKQTKLTANVRSPFPGSQQVVTVKVDGKEVGTWKNSKHWVWEKHSIMIESNNSRPEVSVIEFIFSKHLEPPEKEKRPLALLFESITLE